MGSAPAIATHSVKPGEDYTWEVSFTAPTKPGKYTAFFRMQTPTNIRFGHKVWCDIQVEEANNLIKSKTPKDFYLEKVEQEP